MKCSIGIDYGTQSARAILVNIETGEVLEHAVAEYTHPLSEDCLVDGADYDDALLRLMQAIAKNPNSRHVVGVAVDATTLTLVPLAQNGRLLSEVMDDPLAKVKLWCRHSAAAYADRALKLARDRGESFIHYTGDTISSEWMLPKLLETYYEAPAVFKQMDIAFDLCDYLTFRLTGNITRSAASLSYKCSWLKAAGFPSTDYLDALAPGFGAAYEYRMRGEIMVPGQRAGLLTDKWRSILGVEAPVAVAVGQPDGNTPSVGLGAIREGDVTIVLGTSSVLMMQVKEGCTPDGLLGIAPDGVVPGLTAMECGSNCAGEMLNWFVQNMLTAEDAEIAARQGISAHELLASRVSNPWNNRLIALDWWNGSRCAPCDLSLSGTLIGMRLDTRSHDIYLALLQSMATGMRDMLALCCQNGGRAGRIYAGGGIVKKNPLLMQQFANILGMPIAATTNSETGALGSAILAAVAAGEYPTPEEACDKMAVQDFLYYEPDMTHREDYKQLYERSHRARQVVAQLQHELA